jgi:acyl-coenzyme A synthetase/AMP-(fatty) acid ligase
MQDTAAFMEQEGKKERKQLVRHARLTEDLVDESVVKLCAEFLQPQLVWMTLGKTECASNWMPIVPLLSDSNGSITIGKVAPGSRAKVVDMQSGDLVRIGLGKVHVRTPNCIDGYLDGRHAELWYQANGHRWFNAGDIGYFNEQGAMFVTGCSKDVVVCKGVNIYPSIIEGCLNSVQGVDGSEVVGVPHDHYGAVPVAIVKLRNSMEDDAQAKFFNELNTKVVAEQGEPMMLHSIYLGFQNWPRNLTDKILKSKLVARIASLRQ